MRRPGHHRPVGSLTAAWRFSWNGDEPPTLGDVCFETYGPGGDPDECERAFLLVGIEETGGTVCPYRLTFERLAWDAALELLAGGARTWCFYHERR